LVTGAFGGMGFKVTEWLIDQGAKQLLLLARSALSESEKLWLNQVKAGGITIYAEAVDVSDYSSLERVVNKHCTEERPLAGIFHSAGVYADSLILDYDWRQFSKVFPAKVQGSWNLHQLCTNLEIELDYFVLFSSSAALLAPAGLANYVTSNAFLDALAYYRQQKHLAAHSINWGIWQDTGMAATVSDNRRKQWQVMGVKPMQQETALDAMQSVISSDQANLAILDIDFDQYVNNQESEGSEHFFQSVLSQSQSGQCQVKTTQTDSINVLLQRHPDQQHALMFDYISQTAGSILGLTAEIDPRRGFFELGMDSLTSMEFRNRLQRELQITLDATITFKYPSVFSLSEYLLGLLIKQEIIIEAPTSVTAAQQTDNSKIHQPVTQSDTLTLDDQLDDIDRFLNDAG
nr:ketoreductase and phosphopantetheine attachment site domain-containing protein [Gammaproteobacteria bacterium]